MLKVKLNLRKVLAIAICLVGVTMFSGCNKDDGPSNETNIVGVWIYEKAVVKELKFESGVPAELQAMIENELLEMYDEDFAGMIYDFRNAGKLILSLANGEDPEEDSYTIDGNVLTITDPEGFAVSGQYSISGNKLTWDTDMMTSDYAEILTEMGVTTAITRLTFNKKDNSSSNSGQWKIKASAEYIAYHAWMVEMGAPSALDKDGYFKQTFKSEQEARKWIDDNFKPYCRPIGGGITECSDANLDELYEVGKIGTPVKMP
ncbi:MAG: lipocalin family protein [Prevotellaceae bacterium]|jgi:hypothetical protein|nr:lipocalin family protein [Prevotellaceae bacterium]